MLVRKFFTHLNQGLCCASAQRPEQQAFLPPTALRSSLAGTVSFLRARAAGWPAPEALPLQD